MSNLKNKWSGKSEDEIYEELDNLSPKEQIDFLISLSELKDLPQIDWIDCLLEIIDELLVIDQIDSVLKFTSWYKSNFPDFYKENYEFVEKYLINYFIYKNDWENVKKRILVIKENPVDGIDVITVRLVYQLLFNFKFEELLDFCESVWKNIADSDKLWGSPEEIFTDIIYLNKIQDYYEKVLNNEKPDKTLLLNELEKIQFTDEEIILKNIKHFDSTNIESIPSISTNSLLKEYYALINCEFMKYMYHKYKLPFVFSSVIFSFFGNSELYPKKKYVKNILYFEKKTLDKYIANQYDNMYGTNNLEIFGKVWAMYYVFEFFKEHNLINVPEFNELNNYYEYFRNTMIKIESDELWNYKFVFNWPGIDFKGKKADFENLFDESRLLDRREYSNVADEFVVSLE